MLLFLRARPRPFSSRMAHAPPTPRSSLPLLLPTGVHASATPGAPLLVTEPRRGRAAVGPGPMPAPCHVASSLLDPPLLPPRRTLYKGTAAQFFRPRAPVPFPLCQQPPSPPSRADLSALSSHHRLGASLPVLPCPAPPTLPAQAVPAGSPTSSPGWTPLATPARRHACGHRVVTTGVAHAPRCA
jgi:hypothetical protein